MSFQESVLFAEVLKGAFVYFVYGWGAVLPQKINSPPSCLQFWAGRCAIDYWACPFLAFCKVGWNMFLLRKWTVSKVLFCIASLESHYTFIHLDDSQTYNSKILLLKTCLSLKWNCKNLILRSAIFCINQFKYNCYSKVLFSFIHSILCVSGLMRGGNVNFLFVYLEKACNLYSYRDSVTQFVPPPPPNLFSNTSCEYSGFNTSSQCKYGTVYTKNLRRPRATKKKYFRRTTHLGPWFAFVYLKYDFNFTEISSNSLLHSIIEAIRSLK